MTRLVYWFRSRRSLHAELANLERHASALAKRIHRVEADRESALRALDTARSRIAQLEGASMVSDGEGLWS